MKKTQINWKRGEERATLPIDLGFPTQPNQKKTQPNITTQTKIKQTKQTKTPNQWILDQTNQTLITPNHNYQQNKTYNTNPQSKKQIHNTKIKT